MAQEFLSQLVEKLAVYQAPINAYLSQFPLFVSAQAESLQLYRFAVVHAKPTAEALIQSALFKIICVSVLALFVSNLLAKFLSYFSKHGLKNGILLFVINLVKIVPFGNRIIEKQQNKVRDKIRKQILEAVDLGDRLRELPDAPMAPGDLLKQLQQWKKTEDQNWQTGKVSGAVYLGEDKIKEVVNQAYALFSLANPLHPELFPYVRKMEAEIVRMTVSLFNGNDDCCGTMTSGGTESILMAIKSYREQGYARGIKHPELVIPVTAHAAFLKACDYFCIKAVMVPIDSKTFRVNMKALRRSINSNTIALVASAPGFPHGVMDPVEEMAKLAVSWGIGLHVDCCLGSFLLPLVATLPEYKDKVPPFDFRVNGVTSISCDPHKYGFTPKGTSVIMYSTPALRRFQYFVAPNWTGGMYASPSIAGSRSGGVIAGAWATMISLGRSGYVKIVKDIMRTRDRILDAIKEMPELVICGNPESSVFAFMSRDPSMDIYKVQESMTNKGWHLNALQYPRSVHLCVTYLQVGKHEVFIRDLRESVADVVANPSKYKDGTAAVYGMAESMPDRSLVTDMTATFLDTLYEV